MPVSPLFFQTLLDAGLAGESGMIAFINQFDDSNQLDGRPSLMVFMGHTGNEGFEISGTN